MGDSLLSWRISTLPAGSERVILLKVKPTKAGGAIDHAATVTFQAGSKATSRVLRPRLKLEVVQTPTEGKVLKNKTAEFRIAVTNTGDGPARNVIVQAKLSPGLRHETGERNEDNSFELPIQEIGPGQREDLDPLTVDAIQGGQQWCRVTATSPDVDFDKEEAEVDAERRGRRAQAQDDADAAPTSATPTRSPRTRSRWRTRAPRRPGTSRCWRRWASAAGWSPCPPAPSTTRPRGGCSGRSPRSTPARSRRTFPFEVRMGGISAYEVNVEARGDNGIYLKDRKITDVQGMADVDLVVRERRRVVDVDGTTTFQIRLRNYGTKEATKLQVRAKLSDNLVVDADRRRARGGGVSGRRTATR